jgi:hypothetical protein
MTRRKGEISQARLRREVPHHVTLSRGQSARRQKLRHRARLCRNPIGDAADVLDARDDLDFVVFCFAKPHGPRSSMRST